MIQYDEDGTVRIVASLAEAWIEIIRNVLQVDLTNVASRVEAWIEIKTRQQLDNAKASSLPLWKRGLKCRRTIAVNGRYSRFPCGSVD